MNIYSKYLSLALVGFGLEACTSRKHCNAIDAELIGAADGKGFDSAQSGLKRGAVCTEEYTVMSFRKDYENGFTKALREACTVTGVTDLALLDVAQNATGRPGFAKVEACHSTGANLKALRAAYDNTFVKSMCTGDRVSLLAVEHGKKLSAEDTAFVDGVCENAPNHNALAKAYKTSYAQALIAACDFAAIKSLAQKDVRQKITQAQRVEDLARCPGDQWNIKQLYSSTYDTEALRIQMEDEQRRRQEAERLVAERSNVVVVCNFVGSKEVEVTLNNLNGHQVDFKGGAWEIRLLDNKGKMVTVDRTKKAIRLKAGKKQSFKHKFPSYEVSKSSQCGARYASE